MKRKIVQQGAATLMVSLPSKWARENGLGKGDEVEIEERHGELVVGRAGKAVKKEITLDISSSVESSVRTIITSAYRSGYDKLIVNYTKKDILFIIKDVVATQLLGFEIIKEGAGRCEIANITEPSPEQFENIFNKVLMNIEELFSAAFLFLEGKKQDFEAIVDKTAEFDNFCRRVIVKNKKGEHYQLEWAFHSGLNRGGREIYHLLQYLSKNKVVDKKEVVKLLISCREIFFILRDAYRERDLILIEKLHEFDKKISVDGYLLLKKGKDGVAVHRILSAARQFYLASSPLTGVVIGLH